MQTFIEFIKRNPNVVSAVAALCGIFVSLLAIVLTVITLLLQRRHNFKSVTPIASVSVADYENRLTVKLRNTGIGPLIVTRARVSDGSKEKDDIISWMPRLPEGIVWSTFYERLDGSALRVGGEAILIELSGEPTDQNFARFRDQVRKALSRLTVNVEYMDIYDRAMPLKSRSLAWYGRHFGVAQPPATRDL